MKYSKDMQPLVCMMTESRCYNRTSKMQIKGVLWHSTGCNNPTLKRYVQPSSNDEKRSELLFLIGKNNNGNDWNDPTLKVGVNAWIGKLADGSITTIQALPWEFAPYGCASGKNGSCNQGWIQFEICEDGLYDKIYFDKVYREACELTAFLCKEYNLDPQGTVVHNGVKVPVILCHADAHSLGLGSNHSDVMHWFKIHGKTMKDVREDIASLLSGPSQDEVEPIEILFKKGVINSPEYWKEQQYKLDYLDILLRKIANAAISKTETVAENAEEAIAHLVKVGVINTADYWLSHYSKIKYLDLLLISAANHIPEKFESYVVSIIASMLNYYSGPGASYTVNGQVKRNQAFTIVEEKNGWGKLKSGAGWIDLKQTKKI